MSMSSDSGDEDFLPYPDRKAWKGFEPLPQNDGPLPLAVIKYSNEFDVVHSYFRAIQAENEFSQRALALTADVIDHNSANYTAWYYRRRCLKELDSDLEEELEFTDKWVKECPKNYQVWYHRRWIITELHEKLKQGADEDKADKIRKLGEKELEEHAEVMKVNEDFKNYNGWSHRQFIASMFNLWENETQFVEDLLHDDICNNSAWNHRYTSIKNTTWPITPEVRRTEIAWTLRHLRRCANNESAWNYLGAYLGSSPDKVPWDSDDEVVSFVKEVLSKALDPGVSCRFANEAMARIHEAGGRTEEALEQYELLKQIDPIRASYWDWRMDVLKVGDAL